MSAYKSESGNSSTSQLNLETDVLVIGGGLSATWAAWNVAVQGVKVLIDKGYYSTSKATAPSGTGVWYVPPDPEQREAGMASREVLGGLLRERCTDRAEQLSLLLVVVPFSVKLGVREQSAKMFMGRNKLPTDPEKAFNFE
ncbi:FAD-binding protein [Nostoc sp.]|uniref:FAD-binding protein n=1 Tax=Nostoc sp. TaxID=1180 RepID=UPI002FFC4350